MDINIHTTYANKLPLTQIVYKEVFVYDKIFIEIKV